MLLAVLLPCLDFQAFALEVESKKKELASFCAFVEGEALSPEYEQRVSDYLKELEKMYPETQQDTMQEGKEFFTRLHDSLPFYIGMSKQDAYQRIKKDENRILILPKETDNPLILFWNNNTENSESQNFFSTAWIEISLKENVVQTICVAPGNLSGAFPGFLFDGEVFHKNEGENEGRN